MWSNIPYIIAISDNISYIPVSAVYLLRMKRVVYRKQASKALRRLPPKLQDQIRGKIMDHAAGKYADVIRLKGSDLLRIRCGDWRVIVADDEVVVDVIKIAPRGDAYKDF